MRKFVVYILRTAKNTLYTGQTGDLKKRLLRHKGGTGAKYMRNFKTFKLVYKESFDTRSEAMKREAVIKGMTKIRKERLVLGSRASH